MFAVALLSVVVATGLKLPFPLVGVNKPFLGFFAAVIVTAWYGGTAGGLVATLLATLAATLFFVGRPYSFAADSPHEYLPVAIFVAECVLISYVSGLLHFAHRRADRNRHALQGSERQYRLMVENVRDYAMYMTDPQGTVTKWNVGAERVLGWPEKEIVGTSASVTFTPEDRQRGDDVKEMETAKRDGHAANDRWHQRKDGTRFFAEGMMMRVDDEAGNHLGYTTVLRDTTAQRQGERELAEARAKALAAVESERNQLAEVIDLAPSFMAVLRGPQHVFELVNGRYLDVIGRRDVVGKAVRDALPEIEGQGFYELLDRVYATGEPHVGTDVRVMLQRVPGGPLEERFVDFVNQATRHADGTITGVFVHGIDLTERKRAEERVRAGAAQLERQARIFDTTLSSITDFAYILDRDGRFLFANPPLLKLWGLSLDEAVGKDFFDLKYPDDLAARLQQQVQAVYRTGDVIRDETPYVSPAGVAGHYEYIFSPVRAADGSVEVVAGSTRDITSRKRAEHEREVLLASERAARAEAERAGRMKDEFLATLSHELRTPLNAILGWSQILRGKGGATGDDLAEGLATIERNARAQTQIIEDLLDMSRIISGKVRLEVQRIDLAAVVQAGIDTVRPAANAKDIRVQAVLGSSAGPVSGDPNRLHQVVWNLLTNAVKFTPKGGRVQVLLEQVESHVQVSVIDTGEGISPEFLPHVFDRFRQADASTTRRHGGLGLGLSIVKQLVELHGGSVRVTSAGVGRGTTFTVSLPLVAVDLDPQPEHRREHPEVSVPSDLTVDARPQLPGVRVLVVDDEADARALVRRLLEDCGAVVRTAASAQEAMTLFEADPPDVLISDIGIPGEDGYSLMQRVRALGKERGGGTPSLALTAYARPEDRVRAVRAGFDMHVAKPVEPVELVTMVASLAGRNGKWLRCY